LPKSSPKEPVEQVTVDAAQNRASAVFRRGLYPLDAVYGAAYVFIDRCYVLLDLVDEDRLKVELTGREQLDGDQLRRLAGEFGNELLTHAWRHRVTEANRPLVEAVCLRALAGAGGLPTLDELGEDELSDDAFDDPLGIAVPWEEKYGKPEKG